MSGFQTAGSRILTGPDGFAPDDCPNCQSGLAFHQPDPEQPYRLLATCIDCKAWYLLDSLTGKLTLLPGEIAIHLGDE